MTEGRSLGWWLFMLAMGLYLTLSPALFNLWGIPYDSPGGIFLVKLHPGTYVLAPATLLLCAHGGNPLRGMVLAFAGQRLVALHLGSILLLLGYTIFRHGASGSAFVIESLVTAPLCALAVTQMNPREKRILFLALMAFITVNAAIGIGESLLRERLVPYTVAGGVEIRDQYFRSTALLGHPLENSLQTASMVMLALDLPFAGPLRAGMLAIMMFGLLAFGSRTAFLMTGALLAVVSGLGLVVALLRGRFTYGRIMGGGALAMLALALAVGAAAAAGLGERIFGQLVWDDSADVRLQIWSVFDYMTRADLLFGISPADIETVIYRLGLNYPQETIENFWLLMLMQFGVVGMVPFVGGLFMGGFFLWRQSSIAGRLALLLFLAVASSNNSMASKCHNMAILYAALAAASRPVISRGNTSKMAAGQKSLKQMRN